MRSSKSRSRNKSNRQRSIGNIINRVFDSSGPEGKVRGTPQQIIDKYLALARDAQLGNDRVAEQNFLQHAEHYTRMLGEAQREMAREQEERQRNFQPNGQNGNGNGNGGRDRQDRTERDAPQSLSQGLARSEDVTVEAAVAEAIEAAERGVDVFATMPETPADDEGPGLVETPEMRAEKAPVRPHKVRAPVEPPVVADPAPVEMTSEVGASGDEPADAEPVAEETTPVAKKPRAPRRPRKPRAPKEEGAAAPSEAASED